MWRPIGNLGEVQIYKNLSFSTAHDAAATSRSVSSTAVASEATASRLDKGTSRDTAKRYLLVGGHNDQEVK